MDKAYADTVRLMLTAAPDVFADDIFAMKGGTAISLIVQDMPRLSVDIDVVYIPRQPPREHPSQRSNHDRGAYPSETRDSPPRKRSTSANCSGVFSAGACPQPWISTTTASGPRERICSASSGKSRSE
jgi:hypothetical protein